MGLRVIQAGAFATVQDLGRIGFLAIGMPPSGAMDPVSHRLANLLLGNQQSAATLEIAYIGPEFIVESVSVRLCVVGEGSSIEVTDPEPRLVEEGQATTLFEGARFRVKMQGGSALCYLAVESGFDVPLVMESAATYVRGAFGGLEGRALQAGDELPIFQESVEEQTDGAYKSLPNRCPDDPAQIRVVMGPQDTHFTKAGIETFLNETFEFSRTSDRMGARLDGPMLEVKGFENFISDGITQGAIQVPGGGQPIILMADHQTSGGYPKIATVVSADLPLLGRMKPGHKIRFKALTVNEARSARLDLEQSIKNAVRSIHPVTDGVTFDLDALLSGDHASGFVNADEGS